MFIMCREDLASKVYAKVGHCQTHYVGCGEGVSERVEHVLRRLPAPDLFEGK